MIHGFQALEKWEPLETCLTFAPLFLARPSDSLPSFDSIRHEAVDLPSIKYSRCPENNGIS